MTHPAEGPEDMPDPRPALVAACEAARLDWKAAPFAIAPLKYTTYLEACARLYEHLHPHPTD